MARRRAMQAVMEEERLKGPQAPPTGLRHGFAVIAVSGAIPRNVVQQRPGHTRATSTAICADAIGAEVYGDRQKDMGVKSGPRTFRTRQMDTADRQSWAAMRAALWPDEALTAHSRAVEEFLQGEKAWGFIVETPAGDIAGFAEIALRDYANGCDSRPVPFLEGIWVEPQFRRCGVGALLMRQVEAFLLARGFHELGSDTGIGNHSSQAAHLAWGFSETERVVYFRKLLFRGRSANGEIV